MNYLIDGHNLIGKMPDISLDDPNDEVKLVLRLRNWTAVSPKRQVTLFFDGGLPGGKSRHLSSSQIKVIFAAHGRTADSLIIQRIQKARNPAEYTLISSDQEVIRAATGRQMPHVTAEVFAAQLVPSEPTPKPSSQPDDPKLNAHEVAEWLELFGPVPTARPPKPDSMPPPPKTIPVTKSDPASVEPPLLPTRRSLNIAKSAPRNLTADEVDEWLDIFNNRDKGKG